MSVQIHQQEVKLTLRNREVLKNFIPTIFQKEKTRLESLDIIFCTDKFLLQMNSQFLNHTYYTDIITFNFAEENLPIVGELYISVDRVRDNSMKIKTSFKSEIHRVIFHGCIHLCGYGDKTEREIITMRKKEDFFLKEYFSRLCFT